MHPFLAMILTWVICMITFWIKIENIEEFWILFIGLHFFPAANVIADFFPEKFCPLNVTDTWTSHFWGREREKRGDGEKCENVTCSRKNLAGSARVLYGVRKKGRAMLQAQRRRWLGSRTEFRGPPWLQWYSQQQRAVREYEVLADTDRWQIDDR